MMEVGKSVLQKNNFSDLNDVRYVLEPSLFISMFLTFQNAILDTMLQLQCDFLGLP